MVSRMAAALLGQWSLRFAIAFFIFSMVSHVNLSAQVNGSGVQPRVLSDTTHRVVFDSSAFFGEVAAAPEWNNDYLISRRVETFEAGVPNVRLYDRAGSKVSEVSIWFPGSQRVLIYSASATLDGGIIAGGKAERSDGSFASFIALIDSAGKMTSVIQTKDFAPANVCQAPDGTVWSFGGTGYDENSVPRPGGTLRHFDFQKGELGAYLPRSTFPKQLHPGPEVLAYIRCSSGGVVAYSASAREYIEMKYGDETPHLYHADAPSNLRLFGFAVTDSRNVYGYFSRAGRCGLFYLTLEAAGTAEWLPVEGTLGAYTKPGVITGLLGSEGEQLLVNRAEDKTGAEAVHWVTPTE